MPAVIPAPRAGCSGSVLFRGPGTTPMRVCTCHYGDDVEPLYDAELIDLVAEIERNARAEAELLRAKKRNRGVAK